MAVKQNLDFSTHDFVKCALQDNKTIESIRDITDLL